ARGAEGGRGGARPQGGGGGTRAPPPIRDGVMSSRYLVTGASRGLGAEFVRQLRARGDDVVAAVRDPGKAGDAARAGATVLHLDVDRPDTFEVFAGSLDGPVDVLITNPAIPPAARPVHSL